MRSDTFDFFTKMSIIPRDLRLSEKTRKKDKKIKSNEMINAQPASGIKHCGFGGYSNILPRVKFGIT